MTRLFDLPPPAPAERFDTLLDHKAARIERIVSWGQTTPPDAPLVQDHDEWVLLLAGGATLWIEGEGERRLGRGDWLLIPAGRPHRVTWTRARPATLWLAVHLGGPPGAAQAGSG